MIGRKGQGSLEYILLIGGAVLVAVIVIALVTQGASTAGQATATTSEKNAFCGRSVTCGTCITKLGAAPLANGEACKAVYSNGVVYNSAQSVPALPSGATSACPSTTTDSIGNFTRCAFQ